MGSRLSLSPIVTVFLPSLLLFFSAAALSQAQNFKTSPHVFGNPFNSSYYTTFKVIPSAAINYGALQVTPDSAGNVTRTHQSGRIFFKERFKLWEDGIDGKVASFNTSFLINIFPLSNGTAGEGLAFLIAPEMVLPPNSSGQFLGLTNSTTDGNTTNQILAIELDTYKQDFDPDDNHIGLDINTVRSVKAVSLSEHGIQIAPNGTKFYAVWIDYDGRNKSIQVYITEQKDKDAPLVEKPENLLFSYSDLDLKKIVKQDSYFGFSASTGDTYQLNCVLRWNLTVEILPGDENAGRALKIGLGVGVPVVILVLIGGGWLVYRRRRGRGSDPNIMGTLKSLPGTPREFSFRELKKATNNFNEKHKLGEGGFGMVYKGLLQKEKLEVAVKRFSRDDIKSKDDFLAELTIINRLRHKHLVRLLGWCHKNGVLLLVYEYMPNGSLDKHLFAEPGNSTSTLMWNLRYNIMTHVASALHYLHNEYDQKVVHRDLKASNIMLDSKFNARLGDFGLARALENEKTSYAELEGVHGTMGYIAPECFHTGKATRESDVFAFGAVLLEVVCGKRPSTKIEGFQLLADWVWYLHREGRILDAMDERLGNDWVVEEAERLLLLALACSHPIASERPKTQTVVQIISGSVSVPYVPPFKPAFVWPSVPALSFQSDLLSTTSTTTTSEPTPIHTTSSLRISHVDTSMP